MKESIMYGFFFFTKNELQSEMIKKFLQNENIFLKILKYLHDIKWFLTHLTHYVNKVSNKHNIHTIKRNLVPIFWNELYALAIFVRIRPVIERNSYNERKIYEWPSYSCSCIDDAVTMVVRYSRSKRNGCSYFSIHDKDDGSELSTLSVWWRRYSFWRILYTWISVFYYLWTIRFWLVLTYRFWYHNGFDYRSYALL